MMISKYLKDVKPGKIFLVRHYSKYREDFFEVCYNSGIWREYTITELPKTIISFIDNAEHIEEKYNSVFNRNETIYRA